MEEVDIYRIHARYQVVFVFVILLKALRGLTDYVGCRSVALLEIFKTILYRDNFNFVRGSHPPCAQFLPIFRHRNQQDSLFA